jgi:hypothetical protein
MTPNDPAKAQWRSNEFKDALFMAQLRTEGIKVKWVHWTHHMTRGQIGHSSSLRMPVKRSREVIHRTLLLTVHWANPNRVYKDDAFELKLHHVVGHYISHLSSPDHHARTLRWLIFMLIPDSWFLFPSELMFFSVSRNHSGHSLRLSHFWGFSFFDLVVFWLFAWPLSVTNEYLLILAHTLIVAYTTTHQTNFINLPDARLQNYYLLSTNDQ